MNEFFSRMRIGRDHRWAPGHMSDYLDGELSLSQRRRMQQHAQECPDCRRHLAMLRRMLTALHGLAPPVGGADALQIAASVRLRLAEPSPP